MRVIYSMLAHTQREVKESKEAKSDVDLFNLICQAAKEKNKAAITQLLTTVCIDVYNGYNTPVSQLAVEGHFEAVTFLRNQFNASLRWIAYGYAKGGHAATANDVLKLAAPAKRLDLLRGMVHGYALGGHVAAANEVLKLAAPAERLTSLRWIAYGYAQGGHVVAANDVLKLAAPAKRLDLLRGMVHGYAKGGHVAAANEVLKLAASAKRPALLQIFVTELKKNNAFATVESSLQTLVIFNPDYHRDIANTFKDNVDDAKEAKVNMKALVPKATKLHGVMRSRDFNYKQASGWIDPSLQIWLLQGYQLVQRELFPACLFLTIASFLSGASMQEMCDVSNQLAMHTRSVRIFSHLKRRNHLLIAESSMAAPLELNMEEEKGNAPRKKRKTF